MTKIQRAGDPRTLRAAKPSGMTASFGFTLIELLVVVLIIGILAAIALPQYEKAVEKSRAAEALQTLKYLKQMGDIYLLEHGGELPSGGGKLVRFSDEGIEWPGDFTVYTEISGSPDVACNKHWCYTNMSTDWGRGSGFPDSPMACRGTYNGYDEPDRLYCLEYVSENDGDYRGQILCNHDSKNYCSLFGTTNEQPIKM